MKLTNINNYTHQEMQDIITQVKAYMQVNDLESTDFTVANYQEQFEDEKYYYEIYNSVVTIDEDTTVDEAILTQVQSESLVKEYKTKRGLLQAFLNDEDVNGEYYRLHTQL
ncbi:hypothetical protein PZN54_10985 [Staphylococcus capitis]|uniref:hypothetical protein n=1 Tax=Staphylococcus capitis TaxID=29388 RepID=UPI00248176C3|nr:hypothetical protein [Staphylococcus capitis]MDH9600761.1 hypothetical protein [Staphylococcus capitis]MDH9624325.1 hypothetical protein [Staphylococcus capitis]